MTIQSFSAIAVRCLSISVSERILKQVKLILITLHSQKTIFALPECWLVLGNNSNLNVRRLKISSKNVWKSCNSQLDNFIMSVILLLLVFLFEIRRCLSLFNTHCSSTITAVIACNSSSKNVCIVRNINLKTLYQLDQLYKQQVPFLHHKQ